jgi:hypothetical protein
MFGGRTIGVPSVSRDSGMSLSVSGVDGASDRHFARPSEPVAAQLWSALFGQCAKVEAAGC